MNQQIYKQPINHRYDFTYDDWTYSLKRFFNDTKKYLDNLTDDYMGEVKKDIMKRWDNLIYYKDLAYYANDPDMRNLVARKNKPMTRKKLLREMEDIE